MSLDEYDDGDEVEGIQQKEIMMKKSEIIRGKISDDTYEF